jgi:DNA-binding transcriptional MerR regulator/effector-binding domain-containing protein
LYSIGEFSRITGLTTKALHLYHEKGLLVPDAVDQSSGYRRYNHKNLEKARAIILLKDMLFSLNEISEILKDYDDDADVIAFLEQKRGVLETQIKQMKAVSTSLEKMIQHEKDAARMLTSNEFEIEEKSVDPAIIASIRWKGKYSDSGKAFSKLGWSVGRHISGKPLGLYYDMEYKEDEADIESCFPVRKKFARDGITCRELSGGKCVTLIHKGAYDQLHRSYARVFSYMKEKRYEPTAPIREIYIKGPGMIFNGNPKNYLTEIQIIIAGSEEMK